MGVSKLSFADFSRKIPAPNSAKWHHYPDDADTLELWLADMDFAIMEPLQRELVAFVTQGDLGYAFVPDTYYRAVREWGKRYSSLAMEREWILPVTSAIFGIHVAIQALSDEGAKVAFFTPAYHAFRDSVERSAREPLSIPLVESESRHAIDYDLMERVFSRARPQVFLLCNPHNPTGKMFTPDEIEGVLRVCREYGAVVVSDEVHQDLGQATTHVSLVQFMNRYDGLVVINGPTKGFNIAGVKIANVVAADTTCRERVASAVQRSGSLTPNCVAIKCTEVCYTYGERWLEEVNAYVSSNRAVAEQLLGRGEDGILTFSADGTYFLWMKALFPVAGEFSDWLVKKSKVRLERGGSFGGGYEQYARLTLACNRDELIASLRRIKHACKGRTHV
jgi:cysteine-S-conjugate beta-lyase